MVRYLYKDSMENIWKSSQRKKLQGLASRKQNVKKQGMDHDFCTCSLDSSINENFSELAKHFSDIVFQ